MIHDVRKFLRGQLVLGVTYTGIISIALYQFFVLLPRRKKTTEVVYSIERISNAICMLESGQRGYLLTGNDAYLKQYLYGSFVLHHRVDALKSEAPQDPSTQSNIFILEKLIDLKTKEMAQTVSLYKAGKKEAALQVVGTDDGLDYMERIIDTLDTLRSQQRAADPTGFCQVAL